MTDSRLGMGQVGRQRLASTLAISAIAAGAWVLVVQQNTGMGAASMGLGRLDQFEGQWLIMMAAMMLPSTVPFVRRVVTGVVAPMPWPLSTGVVMGTYLVAWAVFGLAAYVAYQALAMPWPNQNVIAGIAIIAAGLYALTPVNHWLGSRCWLIGGGPDAHRLGTVGGFVTTLKYSGACIGSSAILMLAVIAIGMSNLLAMAAVSVYIFVSRVWHLPERVTSGLAFAAIVTGLVLVLRAA